MSIYSLNPLRDPRWADLVDHHPRASAFHTSGWLDALHRTYGYEPVAFTTSAPDEQLTNAVVFCDVRSWLTGHRLVSLPFSDHCEPLVEHGGQLDAICGHLEAERTVRGWRFIELRPQSVMPGDRSGLHASAEHCLHLLDLRPGPNELFRSFHRSSIQRRIRHAEREGLTIEQGRTGDLVRAFHRLMSITRRRHRLPPQPLEWFHQLAECLGPAMTIRLARRGERAIAGMLTVRHGDTLVYKYGASDAVFHGLGGVPLLFWRTIEDAHATGCATLDFGRSELSHGGLLTFKDRWGAVRSPLRYWQYPAPRATASPIRSHAGRWARQALGRAPQPCQAAAGRLLYRHVG